MSTPKLHANELDIDTGLVRDLIAAQFPQWAHLPVRPARALGTVHALYRLGDDLVVRLPRVGVSPGEVDKEHHWLPRLAPLLPVDVPRPLGRGQPSAAYPSEWSVYSWLRGENPVPGHVADPAGLARDIAAFLRALRALERTNAPTSERGQRTLASLDQQVRAALEQCHGLIDTDAATRAWHTALRAPVWDGEPVWVHADLTPGNLLLRDGRLGAVLDFGSLGLGDPASDVNVAWTVLPGSARQAFRAALGVDDAAWARARGLALAIALAALPYYQHTHPAFAQVARFAIVEVISEG